MRFWKDYVDGAQPYFDVPANSIADWPFNDPGYQVFPIFNLAVAGSGGGDPGRVPIRRTCSSTTYASGRHGAPCAAKSASAPPHSPMYMLGRTFVGRAQMEVGEHAATVALLDHQGRRYGIAYPDHDIAPPHLVAVGGEPDAVGTVESPRRRANWTSPADGESATGRSESQPGMHCLPSTSRPSARPGGRRRRDRCRC